MTMYVLEMEILKSTDYNFLIKISDSNSETNIQFSPKHKTLSFLGNSELMLLLKKNEYQLRKILHNKREDTFYNGFKIKFALRDNKEVIEFNDKSKTIVLDRRNEKYESYVTDISYEPIINIYTDGCYLPQKKTGAYVVLIKNTNNQLNMIWDKTEAKSSTLNELIAVIEGIKFLKNIEKIRIHSDSRYVIKGLTEWTINWKLNDWFTAQGKKVKNIDYWLKYDDITRGKYIEYQWVKAHSFHFENTLCDYYAKLVARS